MMDKLLDTLIIQDNSGYLYLCAHTSTTSPHLTNKVVTLWLLTELPKEEQGHITTSPVCSAET